MGVTYKSISWNRQKRIYDALLAGFLCLYITTFVILSIRFYPDITTEALVIRSTGSLAIILLHIILLIGPACRLSSAFLPLLYNRRHLGVTMFLVATVHGVFSIYQFHSQGNVNPLISLFTSNNHYESWAKFPFEVFGFFALLILLLMAASSHDFWLNNLSPRIWKWIHMLVYIAYVLAVLHVLTGALLYENSTTLTVVFLIGFCAVASAHVIAGAKANREDRQVVEVQRQFTRVCLVSDIVENRAKVVSFGDERIAIFKYDGKISAISNVCKHQNGPLGEGKIIDGCITCPWHGYQYLPDNGCSPPPFKEKVSTYAVKVIENEIWIDPVAYPEGTFLEPAKYRP
jgi:methionine sulfoxide reductase heme-binding subunit